MEGLRGLAAVTVLIGHTRSHLAADLDLGTAGQVMGLFLEGLLLFFALSGFLLYRPFASGIISGQRYPTTGRFLFNRVLRIYPAYLFVLTLVSFVFGLAYSRPFESSMDMTDTSTLVGYLDPLTYIANVALVQTYLPWTMKTGLGVAWSLTVEVVFYLLLPVVAFVACKLVGRLRPFIVALLPPMLLLIIGIAGKATMSATFHPATSAAAFSLQWGDNWYAVFARSFVTHADLFAFGMFAAVLMVAFEQARLTTTAVTAWRWGSLSIGVVLAGATAVLNLEPWDDTGYAVLFGAVIAFVALPGPDGMPGMLARILESPAFRPLGLISYGMYLWHLPVLWFLHERGVVGSSSVAGFVLNCVLVLSVTSALATATYLLIEKPALRLKLRTDGRRSRISTQIAIR